MDFATTFALLKRKKAGALLIIGQIALSLAIIANALYLVSDRLSLAARPSGVADESRLFRITAVLGEDSPEKVLADKKRDRDLLAAIPGVESVSISNTSPLSRRYNNSLQIVRVPDQETARAEASLYISPDSLIDTLQLKLISGRDFRPEEVLESRSTDAVVNLGHAAIISRALATALFADTPAVGQQIGVAGQQLTVVGVVERLQKTRANPGLHGEYTLLLPILNDRVASTFVVRTRAGERDRVMADAEALLRQQDRRRVIEANVSMEQDRKTRYSAETSLAGMLLAVTALLLLVTASGIIGLVSLWVNQQRRQIGVRRALGARQRDILRMFLSEMSLLGLAGVLLGIGLGLALNELLVRKLEVAQMNWSYLLGGAAILFTLSVVAVLGPARRAARISPAVATRLA